MEIVKAFRHNTIVYKPGQRQEAQLLKSSTPAQRADWLRREIIKGDWPLDGDAPLPLDVQLKQAQAELQHVREAVEENQQNHEAELSGLQESLEEALKENTTLRTDFDDYKQRVEGVAAIISGSLGIERNSDEDGLLMLERFVAGVQADVSESVKDEGTPLTGVKLETRTVETNDAKETPVTQEQLAELLGARAAESVYKAGFNTEQKLKAAKDDELIGLDFVGKGAVEKIRTAFK